jgi:hypothetical protein
MVRAAGFELYEEGSVLRIKDSREKRESQGGGYSFAPGDGASQAKHRLCPGSGRENLNVFGENRLVSPFPLKA